MLVKFFNDTSRVSIIRRTDLTSTLTFHRRYIHAIVVNKYK